VVFGGLDRPVRAGGVPWALTRLGRPPRPIFEKVENMRNGTPSKGVEARN